MGHRRVKDKWQKIINLPEYVRNHSIWQRAGYIGGRYLLDGRYYTEEEFKDMFPLELKYEGVQVDGRAIK